MSASTSTQRGESVENKDVVSLVGWFPACGSRWEVPMKTIRLTRDQLEDLRNELIAINFWDKSYENSTGYNFIEITAWEARRKRLREIIRQLKQHGWTVDWVN